MSFLCERCNAEMTNIKDVNINGDGSTLGFFISEPNAITAIFNRNKYFKAEINFDICLECGNIKFYLDRADLAKLKKRVDVNFSE